MKQLQGTDRLDRQQAQRQRDGLLIPGSRRLLAHIPPPPPTIAADEPAAYQWEVVCSDLHEGGRLTRLMLPLVESYCLEMRNYFRLHQQAEEAGPVLEAFDDAGQLYKSVPTGYTVLKDRAFTKWQAAFKVLFPDGVAYHPQTPGEPVIDAFEELLNS